VLWFIASLDRTQVREMLHDWQSKKTPVRAMAHLKDLTISVRVWTDSAGSG
jgi:hypothetical protein